MRKSVKSITVVYLTNSFVVSTSSSLYVHLPLVRPTVIYVQLDTQCVYIGFGAILREALSFLLTKQTNMT